MRVTRAEVARRAGVSPAVVSYVLNPGMRPVAEETRARVLAAVEELDYRPNAVAQALRSGPTMSLGLLVPDLTNPFFAEVAREIEALAIGQRRVLLLGSTEGDPARELAYVRSFVDRRVDGLILMAPTSVDVLEVASRQRVPVVILDRVPAEGSPVRSVVADNALGMRLAVEHLLELGHERIGLIAGPAGLRVAQERVAGFHESLRAGGVEPIGSRTARAPFTRAGGAEAAQRLLADGSLTALVASSDVQAVGALHVCRERGIVIPDDVSLVSFDGTDLARFSGPPLTVVQQPIRALAEAATSLLTQPVDGGREPVVLEPSLCVRASSGPPGGRRP